MNWELHTPDTAPELSLPVLEAVERAYGFAPNLYRALAESPLAATAYLRLNQIADELTTFPAAERQLVLLAMSAENHCSYCVPAHSAVAETTGASPRDLAAVVDGKAPAHPRLAALVRFARATIRERGHLSETEVKVFLEAGFTRAQLLEIVTFAAIKTLSNYAAHLTDLPVDPEFQKQDS